VCFQLLTVTHTVEFDNASPVGDETLPERVYADEHIPMAPLHVLARPLSPLARTVIAQQLDAPAITTALHNWQWLAHRLLPANAAVEQIEVRRLNTSHYKCMQLARHPSPTLLLLQRYAMHMTLGTIVDLLKQMQRLDVLARLIENVHAVPAAVPAVADLPTVSVDSGRLSLGSADAQPSTSQSLTDMFDGANGSLEFTLYSYQHACV
jgi:hypothetical protein